MSLISRLQDCSTHPNSVRVQCFSTALSSICYLLMSRILELNVHGPYNEGFSSAGCDETLVSGPQSGGQFQEREETSFIQKINRKCK